jgi:hypothetical protein
MQSFYYILFNPRLLCDSKKSRRTTTKQATLLFDNENVSNEIFRNADDQPDYMTLRPRNYSRQTLNKTYSQ